MSGYYNNAPLEMRQKKQWCLWRLEHKLDSNGNVDLSKKPTKCPYKPWQGGEKASTTNPEHWGTFEQATGAPLNLTGPCNPNDPANNFSGIGFVFVAGGGLAGLDLDDVGDDTEALAVQRRIHEGFPSYTERSPSGRGHHIIVKGEVPHGRRRGGVEVYSAERFFTFTGDVTNNVGVTDCQPNLDLLFNQLGGNKAGFDASPFFKDATESDASILASAFAADNGETVKQLYNKGEWKTKYPSQSEADLALINILGFYTQNADQIKTLFHASALGQRDKAKRASYLNPMVAKAMDRQLAPVTHNFTVKGQSLVAGATIPQSGAGSPWITAGALQTKHFPAATWVIPGLLPQGAIIFGGRPKLGKSWLALDNAVAVAEGGFTLGKQCVAGDVLYAALEDTQRRLKSRMSIIRAGAAWPSALSFICELPRADEGGVEIVRSWIVQAANPRLVIIDTLAKVRPGKGRDEGSYDADYKAVTIWKALADEFNIAIVLVHHVRKMVADDPLEMISGTNGLTGAADAIIILNRTSQGCTLAGRGRDLEEFESAVKFNPDVCRWEELGNAADVQRSSARCGILALLKSSEKPMSPTDIALAVQADNNSVRQLIFKMVETGEVEKVARGAYVYPGNNNNKITSGLL
ncbi:phage NrS-1 polymerase family protein [Sphingomonas sp. CFBP 13706]|uniref:phage NrS-1 polymerase family protein n=1 Tax=Sphingomonas sp. CFBP 13706 TaxID=2775314 RepID=UPI001781F10F|nr:AAA family ATPase [Sphingomonas sp. CFBP 13706]MBD8735707.1 AAA family ATPase [Sphingomonas sp. CFBP 13706]